MYSKIFKVFALLVVISMIVVPASAQAPVPPTDEVVSGKYQAVSPDDLISRDAPARYIVLFQGDSLVAQNGGAEGLDAKSTSSQAYLDTLATQRSAILADAEAALGRSLMVRHVYDVILNGVSVELTPDEAAALAAMPGVRKVLRDTTEYLDTDAGPAWIGATSLWEGTAVPDGIGTLGEGILAGIIDSGINFDHPSFSDTPADGFTYEWTGDYLGVCAPGGDPEYADACNDKLVGAYSYTYDAPSDFVTPEDSDGHGSHTASTVAGNTVDLDFYGTPVTISGVAPHAQVISYDVCYPTPSGGQCAGEDSVAAVQQAILDGVDVINYSISGGENPYSDAVELAFLEAFDAGVVVSTSAGNAGPDAATVAHRSPWVLSTAASTHNRKFTSEVNFSNPLYQGITTLAGEIPFTTPVVEGNVKYAGEDGNPLGCADPGYTDNFYDGAIALIRRGTCTFSEKINTAAAAGASGVLIFTDDRAPGAMSVSGTTIPGVMLDIPGTFGQEIADWVAAQTDETVDISAFDALHSDEFGDIMADFSSRGPNTTFDLLKPDVSAPGMEILAAVSDGVIDPDGEAEFDLLQGTSMSSPHDAGAAALLYALHPDWTPAEIKSALMLTAYDGLLKEDKTTPADPFDMGAGRIQLELAGLTGLVMDETTDNMLAADPAEGGDVKTLNIASLYNSSCVGECSWTRTFTSVADLPATYTVSAPEWITVDPAEFTIAPGAAQEITVTADVSAYTPGEWIFGNIEFLTDSTFAGGDPVVVLSQNFTEEAFPPTGWAIYDIDTGDPTPSNWMRDTAQSSSAPASAKHNYDCTQEQEGWLVSPQIAIPADGITGLSFNQRGNWVGDLFYHGIMVSTGSGDPVLGEFIELVQPPDPLEDAWSTTPVIVDLSAYADQSIYVAFKYMGDCADDWWVDDVEVATLQAGAPISDVAIPAAVLPAAGNLPDLVKFETHRDTGGDTLTDLVAVEITDLTVDTFGFVKGVPTELQLAKDPTNGSPYDNLSQVYYTLIPMDAGAARVVAEITASTAPDVDLYWGFDVNGDGLPQEAEEYEYSATATAFEYLSEYGFPVDFYDVWVLVQNWQGSGAATDDITLSLGVVPWEPVDPPTMTVIGPETNEPGVPFALDILWHDVDTEEGDRLYGLMDVYADAAYEVGIGITEVDVVRGADDVIKTADVETAGPGDVITYTIEITNYTTEPIEYAINDVLPDGVTYVPDSVTGGAVYDELTNAITWDGFVDASYRDYVAATSAEDPNCTLGFFADGDPTDAYLDWFTTSNAFRTASTLAYGDEMWYVSFTSYPQFNYYGSNYTGMEWTSEGYAGFDMQDYSNLNTSLPDPTEPNNLMAMFWDDFTVEYDYALNKGVTLVGDGASLATIEYDDIKLNADPTKTMDMEIGYFLQPDDAPGAYEIIYAFDNITPGLFAAASGTIGVE
ncbi:MAG TPA: S8 family serine peptidase, partial [Anaerolineaceae bacterium]|nr:S8 family serine peptidase [Anaerolineaceae bacterium]